MNKKNTTTTNKLIKKIDHKKGKKTRLEPIRVHIPNLQLGYDTR